MRALEDLDPVVIMLQREIEAKKLGHDHIFYKCVKNALEFAKKSSNPREQFQHDESVNTFMEMLEFHGKPKTLNLLRGPGHINQGGQVEHSISTGKIGTFPLCLLKQQETNAKQAIPRTMV